MSAKTNNLCLFKYDPSTDGAQTFNIKQALNDNWDRLDANVLLALAAAAPYSETQTYALGTYCTKDAKLYRCTTAITTTEAWTAAHWTETSMGAELVAIYAALAAKAPSTHAHAASDITSGTLPVTRGGTGATDRLNAFENLAFLGNNPIASTTDDTTTNWVNLGSGYAFFSGNGQLTDQPTTYGFVISFVCGSDIFQLWKGQVVGEMYVRSGNSAGWGQTWAKIYDSQHKPTTSDVGITSGTTDLTAGSSALTTNAIYLVYE